jgi:hypothetical protein
MIASTYGRVLFILLVFCGLFIPSEKVFAQGSAVYDVSRSVLISGIQPPQPATITNYQMLPVMQQFSQPRQMPVTREQDLMAGELARQRNRELIDDAVAEFNSDINANPAIPEAAYRGMQNYWGALSELKAMSSTGLSLTQAVYLVENAYMEGKLPFEKFKGLIEDKVDLCRYIIKKNKLPDNDISKQYAIQKLFSEQVSQYNAATKTAKVIQPYSYDFNDFMGKEHWENMFVSKLLITGKGQCHSMPLLYLIMAEQLGAKAYLSYAPEHSYIQFYDSKGTAYNFETTNGKLVSQNWIMQSGFINASAIKHKTYLDTLDQKKLNAALIMDLALGYLDKFGYDEFVESALKSVQELSPDNLQALILQANVSRFIALKAIRNVGIPPPDKLINYPQAYNLYLQMKDKYNQVDNLGYQSMPPEAYQRWLASVKSEMQKQEDKMLSDRLNKTLKSQVTIHNSLK